MQEQSLLSKTQRLRYRYVNPNFAKTSVGSFFRLLLLIGLTFLILYPFAIRISSSFMSTSDLVDATVRFIPRNATLFSYQTVIEHTNFPVALRNTFILSMIAGSLQMIVCAFIGYGLARFNFRGKGIIFILVIFTIMVPPQTYMTSLFLNLRFFDIYGVFELIGIGPINLLDSPLSIAILSGTGFAFKNGLFIFMMRQYYKGMPDELEEAAYVDGAGVLRTFFTIMIPLSTSMLVTIFILAFAWQWTDTYYTSLFFTGFNTLSNSLLVGFTGIMIPGFVFGLQAGQPLHAAFSNAFAMLMLVPLIIIYLIAQRMLVEGIERAGIVG